MPRLDLVKERIDARDLGLLAERLLGRLEAGEIDSEEVAAVCARIDYPEEPGVQEVWYHFCSITDQKNLIEQGILNDRGFEDHLRERLMQAAELA